MNWKVESDEIEKRKMLALQQGGDDAISKQHSRNRLTIRERIDHLIDPSSFEEIGPAAGAPIQNEKGDLEGFEPANFILGFAKVNGRRVVIGGEDFTMKGGSPSPAGLRKSVYTEELAVESPGGDLISGCM